MAAAPPPDDYCSHCPAGLQSASETCPAGLRTAEIAAHQGCHPGSSCLRALGPSHHPCHFQVGPGPTGTGQMGQAPCSYHGFQRMGCCQGTANMTAVELASEVEMSVMLWQQAPRREILVGIVSVGLMLAQLLAQALRLAGQVGACHLDEPCSGSSGIQTPWIGGLGAPWGCPGLMRRPAAPPGGSP